MAQITYVSRPLTVRELLLSQAITSPTGTAMDKLRYMITFLHLRTDKEVPEDRFLDMEQPEFHRELDRCMKEIPAALALTNHLLDELKEALKK